VVLSEQLRTMSPAPPAGAALVILTTRAERRPALPVFAGRSGPGQAVHTPCDPPKVKPRPRKCSPQAKARASFIGSDQTYGARRVWKDLLAERVSCGLHRIERLMRLQALRARPRRRRLPPELGERRASAVVPNVLDRSFDASAPTAAGLLTSRTSGRRNAGSMLPR